MMAGSLATVAIVYAERLRWPVLSVAGKVPVIIKDGSGCLDATAHSGAIGWWREYLTTHSCKIMQWSAQTAWVAPPSQRSDDDGRCR